MHWDISSFICNKIWEVLFARRSRYWNQTQLLIDSGWAVLWEWRLQIPTHNSQKHFLHLDPWRSCEISQNFGVQLVLLEIYHWFNQIRTDAKFLVTHPQKQEDFSTIIFPGKNSIAGILICPEAKFFCFAFLYTKNFHNTSIEDRRQDILLEHKARSQSPSKILVHLY